MKFDDIRSLHSAARLNRYLKATGGDKRKAVLLYKRNIELCQRFFGLMNLFEVMLRNAIHRHYSAHFNDAEWILHQTGAGCLLHADRKMIHEAEAIYKKKGLTCAVFASVQLCAACSKVPDTQAPEFTETENNMKVGEVSFTAKSGTFAGMQIPWREARINMDKEGDAALVLCLHGGSAKGSDNKKQVQVEEVGVLASYLVRKGIKAIFIVPQCPSAYSWRGSMAKVPFRTVVGTNDNIIDASKVEEFAAEVKALGGEVIFESVKGWGHGQTCTLSYTDERLDWMFSN